MIDYLRISITDRCNLNCLYCKPMEKRTLLAHDDILRYEEMIKIVELFSECGIRKVRITGGEPLIKKNVTSLIKGIKNLPLVDEVAITTNGVLLPKLANGLKSAGLDRINISLDTLKNERYKKITGFNKLEDALLGIKSAKKAGFKDIKLNVVLMKNFNDEELTDFIEFATKENLILRFIELFETNRQIMDFQGKTVSTQEVKKTIEASIGILEKIKNETINGNGPSNYFSLKLKNKKVRIGFISNNSSNFCNDCTRLRMNSTGKISPCLFSGFTHDLKKLLRNGKSDSELMDYIKDIVLHKTDYTKQKKSCGDIEMSSIGG